MTNGILITGTDTGVGKTEVTGLLAHYLTQKGESVTTQKWVQTGAVEPEDIRRHDTLMDRDNVEIDPNRNPYLFSKPASPHFAAELAQTPISPSHLKMCYQRLAATYDWILVEGAGGLMVPLTSDKLIIDLACELDLAVVVVVGNRLGCLNHGLLTLAELKRRNCMVLGQVISHPDQTQDPDILQNNIQTLSRQSVPVLGSLLFFESDAQAKSNFYDIGEAVCTAANKLPKPPQPITVK